MSQDGPIADDVVVIDGEELSPSRRPPAVSRVVRKSYERLLGELDLHTLISSLEGVGSHLDDAYHAVSCFHDLQIGIQRAGFSLTRMGDKALLALESFRSKSDKVLEDLEYVYSLLVDGMEDIALSTLRGASNGSSTLAKDAQQLAKEFEKITADVQESLILTLEKQAAQEERRAKLCAEVEEFRVLLSHARKSKGTTEERLIEAEQLYQETVQKESTANMKNSLLYATQLITLIGTVVSSKATVHAIGFSGATALQNAVDGEIMRAREEKAVHLHEKHKLTMSNLDLSKEIAELSARLRVAREEDQVAQEAVESLQASIVGLQNLSSVMLKAEAFWNRVGNHCGRSDSMALQSVVEQSRALSLEQRAELWGSDNFRRRAVQVYAPWVALRDVCTDYIDKMHSTRSGLYRILENQDCGGAPLSVLALESGQAALPIHNMAEASVERTELNYAIAANSGASDCT